MSKPLISIRENTNVVPLQYPQINCDTKLHPKLDKLTLFKNMNCHFSCGIIGVPGSGKTSLLEALMGTPEYFHCVFQRIFLFMPKTSRRSVEDSVFDCIDENQIFNELNVSTLKKVRDTVDSLARRDPPWKSLIVFDDVQKSFKGGECERILCEMIANRRHARCSFFLLAQNYIRIPIDVRKLMSDLFCFDLSMTEFDNIYNEHAKFYKSVWQGILDYYIQRVREEKEKKERGEPYEKVFLYMNIANKEVFINFAEVEFDKTPPPVEVVVSGKRNKRRREKKKEEESEDEEDELLPSHDLFEPEQTSLFGLN